MLLHTSPGTEAVCDSESHVFNYEVADAAWLAGVQLNPVASDRGRLSASDVMKAIRPGDRHHSRHVARVDGEHAQHARWGGSATGHDAGCARMAVERGLPVHLDGARLWNASAASGTSLSDFAACADTVMVCFSKGLGCPIGSLLAGPQDMLHAAWSVRKRLGGGMRQVGILAAAAPLVARSCPATTPGRPFACHGTGRRRAGRSTESMPVEPDTNIVMIDITTPGIDAADLATTARGDMEFYLLPAGPHRVRAVTHVDVDDDGIRSAPSRIPVSPVLTCRSHVSTEVFRVQDRNDQTRETTRQVDRHVSSEGIGNHRVDRRSALTTP